MAFLGSFLQYLIIMIVLAFVAFIGGFIGVKLRQSKDAKASVEENITSEE